MRSSADVGPFIAVVQKFQHALAERADSLLVWREGPQQGLVADIPEGKLLLTPFSAFWMLTLIYEIEAPANGDAAVPGKVELGRRRIDVGSALRLQRVAIELAQRGVPGGPTDIRCPDGQWIPGARRMVLPTGQLRLSDTAEGPCTLTFENDDGVELLGIGSRDEMANQALTRWDLRQSRPLQLVVDGHVAKLRSIDVAGVLGYHMLADNCFIALVHEGDDLALVLIQGLYPYLLARVSWEEAIHGETFDVDALMNARNAANHGPSANEAPGLQDAPKPAYTSVAVSRTADVAEHVAPAIAGSRPSCPPGYTPMSEYNRALCRWYLEWLHARLKGRGARKARVLVLRILEALDWCRVDITGTRAEVHAALVRILGTPTLSGEDRNIRDALDLLASQSHFAHRTGTQCTLVLSQFHDLNSALMRRIVAEKIAAEGGVANREDARTAVVDPPETATASPREETVVEASIASQTMPTSPETAEVPPEAAETGRVTESAPERPMPAQHGAPQLSGLEAVAAFLATPPASALPNITAKPSSSASPNSVAVLTPSAPTSLTSVPSSGEAELAPAPEGGTANLSPSVELALGVTFDPPGHVTTMDEPRTCPIVWSAFAGCESSQAEEPEPSAKAEPDVSLSGFTRRPVPRE